MKIQVYSNHTLCSSHSSHAQHPQQNKAQEAERPDRDLVQNFRALFGAVNSDIVIIRFALPKQDRVDYPSMVSVFKRKNFVSLLSNDFL